MNGISKRLSIITDMVTTGSVVADIGCDHGYVSIGLVSCGICERAIACDINEGPLERAANNIKAANLSDKIELRCADGLSAVEPGEADRIVITGMGGDLIADIIKQSLDTARSAEELVLGPQTRYALLRSFLWENGFDFLEEDMVCEDGKYYPLIRLSPVRHDESQPQALTDAELKYGPLLIRYRHPVLIDYLMRQQRVLMNNRIAASYGKDTVRTRELEREIKIIRDLLSEMRGDDYDS